VATARSSAPNSATSKFFINVADNLFLDYTSPASPGYAVFGKVVGGIGVSGGMLDVPPRMCRL
jgi:cyclophilin family peptidyl-prolyl cis-trans isomerase